MSSIGCDGFPSENEKTKNSSYCSCDKRQSDSEKFRSYIQELSQEVLQDFEKKHSGKFLIMSKKLTNDLHFRIIDDSENEIKPSDEDFLINNEKYSKFIACDFDIKPLKLNPFRQRLLKNCNNSSKFLKEGAK